MSSVGALSSRLARLREKRRRLDALIGRLTRKLARKLKAKGRGRAC